MKICKKCRGIAEWNSYYGRWMCTRCDWEEEPEPSNYEKLLSGSPEGLAHILSMPCPPDLLLKVSCPGGCERCWLEWLNKISEDKT